MKSPQDELTDAVEKDLFDYFAMLPEWEKNEAVSAALLPFDDDTGRYARESGILRYLLFGRLALNRRFNLVEPGDADRAYSEMFPDGKLNDLTRPELTALGTSLNADYLLNGRVFEAGNVLYLQLFLRDLKKGVLLYTPIFRIPDIITQPEAKKDETAPEAEPGALTLFEGEMPDSYVVDFDVFEMDSGKYGVGFITNSTFEVYSMGQGNALKREWIGEHRNPLPARGLAGAVNIFSTAGATRAIVTLNAFKHSYQFVWNEKKFKQEDNVKGFRLDRAEKAWLTSEYGAGVISFSGAATAIVVPAKDGTEKTHSFPLPVDYYSACIFRWDSASMELTQVAALDELGALHVYAGGGKEVAATDAAYGGSVDCAVNDGTRHIIAATDSGKSDAVVLMKLEENGLLREVWRSRTLNGGIYHLKFVNPDNDGAPQVAGTLDAADGKKKFFIAAPSYEDKSGERKNKEKTADADEKIMEEGEE